MKHDNRYVWLDLARGISALLVCAGHLRAAMFVDYSYTLSKNGFLGKLFYFSTGLGHQAVMVFFVLSGFFVGGSVISKGANFKMTNYGIARLSRLWVVLLPALAFTFIVDIYINAYSPNVLSGKYYSTLSSGPKNGFYSDSITTLVGNLFFLQNICVPIFGSNGPLWSLANEFWYYVLFPLIFIAIRGSCKRILARIASALVAVMIMVTIGREIFDGFIILLFGVVTYKIYIYRAPKHRLLLSLVTAALFSASIVDSKLSIITGHANTSSDLLVGFFFALFLISINNASTSWRTKEIAWTSKWLSEISYTLYLTHFPLVLLIFSALYRDNQQPLTALGFVQYIGWLVGLLTIATGMWWLFERNTQTVRLLIQKHLTGAQTRTP